MITLSGVSKSFGNHRVVSDITLEAASGETLVLLGPSGCGKTTTLKMVNRLIEPDSGVISVNGRNVPEQDLETLRRGIGYVMQHAGLFPHYTVYENIAVVPRLLRWTKEKTQARINELLGKLHLGTDVLARYPKDLSGGQQQRVGIARALAADPPVLLMDEPFSALDNLTRAGIHAEFRQLEELRKKTILLVTHDVQEAFELGDRICLMDGGKIVQAGRPQELLYRPANDFVRQFFESYRLLLEHRIARLRELSPFLPESAALYEETGLNAEDSVWAALQQLSAAGSSDRYDRLSEAFNKYRKTLLP